MKFSVILTSFRRPRLVQQAIRSVLAQTLSDFELIVIDDNSGRETWQAIVAQLRTGRDLLLRTDVQEEERADKCRYAVCINMGIRAASGDVITYLTDDDLYYPNRLARMAAKFESDPSIMIVYGDQHVAEIGADGITTIKRQRGTFGITRRPQCHVDHNSFAHRRECLDVIEQPWWPEGKEVWGAADAAFFDKLTGHFDFHPIPEVLDCHRWHRSNVQTRMMAGLSPIYTEEL